MRLVSYACGSKRRGEYTAVTPGRRVGARSPLDYNRLPTLSGEPSVANPRVFVEPFPRRDAPARSGHSLNVDWE